MLIVSLVAGSFATHVVHLILTQGFLYGLGASLVYSPFTFYIDEWFVKRKGLAYGIFWAGTGFCGSITPMIMERAINEYGFRNTLRAWAAFLVSSPHCIRASLRLTYDEFIQFVTLSLLIYFVKPRLAVPPRGVALSLDLGFLRTPVFWIFQFGNMVQGLGYFIPSIYLPGMHLQVSRVRA